MLELAIQTSAFRLSYSDEAKVFNTVTPKKEHKRKAEIIKKDRIREREMLLRESFFF